MGVHLGLTPQGRGPQPSISAGVEDFMLSPAPQALNGNPIMIRWWRPDESGLTTGYFLSRVQREYERKLTTGANFGVRTPTLATARASVLCGNRSVLS